MEAWEEQILRIKHDVEAVHEQARRGEWKSAAQGAMEIYDEAKVLAAMFLVLPRRSET